MIALIVAVSDNNVIGKDGWMPWRVGSDLARFKRLTLGHTILMGRSTHELIIARFGKPLPGRDTIVLSTNMEYETPECTVLHNVKEVLDYWASGERKAREILFVAGGSRVYTSLLPEVDCMYLTRIHTFIRGGNAFFCRPDESCWEIVHEEEVPKGPNDDFASTFYELRRKDRLKK